MKQMRHILYVTEPDLALKIEGQALCAVHSEGRKDKIPFHLLEGIVSFSYASITPAVMTECARRGIGLTAVTPSGKVRFRIEGGTRGNVLLRMRQYELFGGEGCVPLAREMIAGKLSNGRKLLQRFRRNHPDWHADELEQICCQMQDQEKKLAMAVDCDQIRGIEGAAAKSYFDGFAAMIRTGDRIFSFEGRSRRPPGNCCNAMLSFAYALLQNECIQALESVGLDPFVGVLHGVRPGKPALALDIMEELRPLIADRFVVNLINRQMADAAWFIYTPDNGVLLNDDGRKSFLREWTRWRETVIRLWGEPSKLETGLLPYYQANRLAAFLRGDGNGFTRFCWKG